MNKNIISQELIERKIFVIRNLKVMLDKDLALLYGVETRALKQAVKRNIKRFQSDFMFILQEKEINNLVSQNVIPSKSYFGGAFPITFIEQGVSMLSSIIKKLISKKSSDKISLIIIIIIK